MGGFVALGFLKNISQENRASFVIFSSLGLFGCLAGILLVSAFWRRLRSWTWQRAIDTWKRNSRAQRSPKFVLANSISEGDLRQLAVQTYSRMGYRVVEPQSEGIYLYLTNPERNAELVAYKQQSGPVELHHVYSLELEMRRIKAVRAFFWAPAGFTEDTVEWAAKRSIVLADEPEIGRLVDCAQSKGSRLLEYPR
jgi:hypothetical protein